MSETTIVRERSRLRGPQIVLGRRTQRMRKPGIVSSGLRADALAKIRKLEEVIEQLREEIAETVPPREEESIKETTSSPWSMDLDAMLKDQRYDDLRAALHENPDGALAELYQRTTPRTIHEGALHAAWRTVLHEYAGRSERYPQICLELYRRTQSERAARWQEYGETLLRGLAVGAAYGNPEADIRAAAWWERRIRAHAIKKCQLLFR